MAGLRESSVAQLGALGADASTSSSWLTRPLEEYLTTLRKGAWLLKHGRYGKPKLHYFRLISSDTQLAWRSANGTRRVVDLTKVTDARRGQTTEVFKRNPQDAFVQLSFSLLYVGNEGEPRSLDLICPGQDSFDLWLGGVWALLERLGKITAPAVGRPLPDAPDAADLRPPSLSAPSSSKLVRGLSRVSKRSPPAAASSAKPVAGRVTGDIGSPVATRLPGDLYSWGAFGSVAGGKEGEWGSASTAVPRQLYEIKRLDVAHAAIGASHGALITHGGELYTWGDGRGGKLGMGTAEEGAGGPVRVSTLWGRKAAEVHCAASCTAVLTTEGELLTWGDNAANTLGYPAIRQFIPREVPLPDVVAEVSLGPYHAAAITADGRLYTWGEGLAGKLGHGRAVFEAHPRQVAALSGTRVLHVACGYWHTAAVVQEAASRDDYDDAGHITEQDGGSVHSASTASGAGVLYTWGGDLQWQECRTDGKGKRECRRDHHRGCLGLGDSNGRALPTRVRGLLEGQTMVQVVAGLNFTAVVTAEHCVWQAGELAPSPDVRWSGCKAFERVGGGLERYWVDALAAGLQHLVATARPVEQRGKARLAAGWGPRVVFAWGRGGEGQLGVGKRADSATPVMVEALAGRKVLQVAAGSLTTLAVCEHSSQSEDGDERQQLQLAKDFFKTKRRGADPLNVSFAVASRPSASALRAPSTLTVGSTPRDGGSTGVPATESDSFDMDSMSSSSDMVSRQNGSAVALRGSGGRGGAVLRAIGELRKQRTIKSARFSKSASLPSPHPSTHAQLEGRTTTTRSLNAIIDNGGGSGSGSGMARAANTRNGVGASASGMLWDLHSSVASLPTRRSSYALSEDNSDVGTSSDVADRQRVPIEAGAGGRPPPLPVPAASVQKLEGRLEKLSALLAQTTQMNAALQRQLDTATDAGSAIAPAVLPPARAHAPAAPSVEQQLAERAAALASQEALLSKRLQMAAQREAAMAQREAELEARVAAMQREGELDAQPNDTSSPSAAGGQHTRTTSRDAPMPGTALALERYDTFVPPPPQRTLSGVERERQAMATELSEPNPAHSFNEPPLAATPMPLTVSDAAEDEELLTASRHSSPPPPEASESPVLHTARASASTDPVPERAVGAVWNEEVDSGVFLCFEQKAAGPQLMRIRFSRRKFSKDAAEAWYMQNRKNIAERYSQLAGPGGLDAAAGMVPPHGSAAAANSRQRDANTLILEVASQQPRRTSSPGRIIDSGN